MSPLTPNNSFTKPTIGSTGWGANVNDTLDRLDELAINVKAPKVGAIGDGIVDDYDAVQAALDAVDVAGNTEARLFFPGGFYRNATAPWVVKPGTTIEGVGSTIFKHDVPASGPLFRLDGPDASRGTVFRHFRINGPDVRQAPFVNGTGLGHGIHLNGTGAAGLLHTTIEDVAFEGVGDATHWCIYATWALETHIARIRVVAAGGGGVYLGDTSNGSTLRDSTMSNNADGAMGAVYIGADGALVQGNVLEGWRGLYGIKVASGVVGWNLIRNWHEDNDGKNLWLDGSSSNGLGSGTVVGCNIDHKGAGHALYAESVHDTAVIGCGLGKTTLVSQAVSNYGCRLKFINTTVSTLDVTGLVGVADDRYTFEGASITSGRDGIYLYMGGNVSLEKGFFEAKELASSPSTPAADTLRSFTKDADGVTRPHYLDPSGVEWRTRLERAPVVLTDAATVLVDAAAGHFFPCTLTAARTFGAPSHPVDGQEIAFFIYQATGGPITPVWNGVYLVIGGTFTISDNSRRCIKFTYFKASGLWVESGRV